MKRRSSFLAGVLTTLFLFAMIGSAYAAYRTQQATLEYSDVKITLNGQTVTPTDANGKTVEPFIIDGTTYLPVRAVSSALGLDVNWDGTTKTVSLTGGSSNWSSADLDAYYLANQLTTTSYRAESTASDIFQSGLVPMLTPDTSSSAELKRSCALQAEQLDSLSELTDLITDQVSELPIGDENRSALMGLCSDLKYALIDLRVPNDARMEMADAGLTNLNSAAYTNGYNAFWDYYLDDYENGLGNLCDITYAIEEYAYSIYSYMAGN